jgi:hypothetical protein
MVYISGSQPKGCAPPYVGATKFQGGGVKILKKKRKMKTLLFYIPCLAVVLVSAVFVFFFLQINQFNIK